MKKFLKETDGEEAETHDQLGQRKHRVNLFPFDPCRKWRSQSQSKFEIVGNTFRNLFWSLSEVPINWLFPYNLPSAKCPFESNFEFTRKIATLKRLG